MPRKTPVVPIERFGKDHWSTLAYIETRIVDHGGEPGKEHMRCDPDLHPGQTNSANRLGGKTKYATRLAGGEVLGNHDDWSCIEDMEAHGILENIGTGAQPIYRLTDYGMIVANALRNHKAAGGNWGDFAFKPLALENAPEATPA